MRDLILESAAFIADSVKVKAPPKKKAKKPVKGKKKKGKKKSKLKPRGDFDYGLIPVSTVEQSMGKERWAVIMAAIERVHNVKKVFIGYHDKGILMIYLNDERGKNLGTVAEVEEWALKEQAEFEETESK